ncbi:hypothetical protein CC1G_10683 [Coprinopsis cinerea okayama7|uniref:DUF6535 domain-containing protein n=1 Tax=Coprinopsis cinerea (strain Okayama-7 / 130 / ATCC MYA-4618 / FGSC 9003) TaxID=240176 RepID=A8NDR1_COPC7|nr:hypothetical protein CC1G_10683 [Coprinopsis cinerea okayama7\|eukprot:XP_001832834.1 hypothetical protein CC1G_10683 [Coprinopsis cinerea okayama7\
MSAHGEGDNLGREKKVDYVRIDMEEEEDIDDGVSTRTVASDHVQKLENVREEETGPKPFWETEKPWVSGDHFHIPIPNEGKTLEKCAEIVEDLDTGKCNAWKDEIQNLLLFAGLFSAIVTGFAVEAAKALNGPSEDLTVQLLAQISAQLALGLNNTGTAPRIPSIEVPPFDPPSNITRVNILWTVSLTISLTVVTIGILCLQWLREYERRDPGRTPEDALATRYSREQSLRAWKVPFIIAVLPLLLQAALALFLIGLVDYFYAMSRVTGGILAALVGLVLLILIATTALPAISDFSQIAALRDLGHRRLVYCAYRSPQSWAFTLACSTAITLFRTVIHKRLRVFRAWRYLVAFCSSCAIIVLSPIWLLAGVGGYQNISKAVRTVFERAKNADSPKRESGRIISTLSGLRNWVSYDAWWRKHCEDDYILGIFDLSREYRGTPSPILRAAYRCIHDITALDRLNEAIQSTFGPEALGRPALFQLSHSISSSDQFHVSHDMAMFQIGRAVFPKKHVYGSCYIGEWEHCHMLELFVRMSQRGYLVECPSILEEHVHFRKAIERRVPSLPSPLRLQVFRVFIEKLKPDSFTALPPDLKANIVNSMLALLTTLILEPIDGDSVTPSSIPGLSNGEPSPLTHPHTFEMLDAGFRSLAIALKMLDASESQLLQGLAEAGTIHPDFNSYLIDPLKPPQWYPGAAERTKVAEWRCKLLAHSRGFWEFIGSSIAPRCFTERKNDGDVSNDSKMLGMSRKGRWLQLVEIIGWDSAPLEFLVDSLDPTSFNETRVFAIDRDYVELVLNIIGSFVLTHGIEPPASTHKNQPPPKSIEFSSSSCGVRLYT